MEFIRENGILTINLDSILTLALAVILLLVGYGVKNRSSFLRNIVSLHQLLVDSCLCLSHL
ncbi:hypothetical protein [Peptoniphilus sp.]|uniref:hypothetical protein n=1 Tax=Peptoniphilus sp. TaxID=1971214 RepID=UPI002A8416E0|nr:hypothetical protein [Peptoniphilus sp.]MDY3903361.1 hypothetical protein [Peptoniphilus sp.]